MFEKIFVLLLIHSAGFVKISNDNSGIDRVDSHTHWRHFERCAMSQLIDSSLAHAIREHIWKRSQSCDARNIYDVSFSFNEMRHGKLHHSKNRTQVYVEHLIPLRLGCVLNRSISNCSGGVYMAALTSAVLMAGLTITSS